MNLFDVKNAIETIVRLNPGIHEDRLIVLLQAANWDHAHIDEAVILFRGMTPEILAHQIDEKHLLESKKEATESVSFDQVVPTLEKEAVASPYAGEASHPIATSVPKEDLLPSNLPLKPFDSSPHVISFSKYKDIYHNGEVIPVLEQSSGRIVAAPGGEELVHVPNTGFIPKKFVFDPTEPLTGTDISLVFIVTLLILTILLLMGYMYTNGRLFID